jgi:hypothetical protein
MLTVYPYVSEVNVVGLDAVVCDALADGDVELGRDDDETGPVPAHEVVRMVAARRDTQPMTLAIATPTRRPP